MSNELYMEVCLSLAKIAYKKGEVPVGAIVVDENGKIIGKGYNTKEKKHNSLYHAEMIAINAACKKKKSWRLLDCTLYVTLEPCPMCAGAIVNSRIKKVVYGACDKKAGAIGSVFDINLFPLNHKFEVESRVLEEKCSSILSDFFKEIRK